MYSQFSLKNFHVLYTEETSTKIPRNNTMNTSASSNRFKEMRNKETGKR